VTVDFDKTVFLQMALFALLVVVLKPLLFDPMLRLFALREARTDGARAEARSMQEQAADLLGTYEAKLAAVRVEAAHEREALRRETSQLEEQILAEARQAAESIAVEGRARIAGNLEAFERELSAKEQVLATEVSGRLLGRGLGA
jgi:F-type H+-transporting ATPase subunit b